MARHRPCLILNADYTPLHIVSWKSALCDQIIGKEIPGEGVRVIAYYENDIVYSAGGVAFPIPAVAVCNRYIRKRKKIALKKKNILIRDNRTCQYCGIQVTPSNATIDHVIPRSQHQYAKDAHKWNNVVIACLRCNVKKDNKTPEQAGMKLLSIPKAPSISEIDSYTTISPWIKEIPEEWSIYIGN